MNKILITGGAGFIGTALVNLALEKKFQVICVDNLKNSKRKFLIKFLKNKNFFFSDLTLIIQKTLKKSLKKKRLILLCT